MGMFSEVIAEANVNAVVKLRDEYLADPSLSEEQKQIIKTFSDRVIWIVAD